MFALIRKIVTRGPAKAIRILRAIKKKLFIRKVIKDKEIGDACGRVYELWKADNDGSNASMTVKRAGRYSCRWEKTVNVLFRVGCRYGSCAEYDQMGQISLDYAAHYTPEGDSFLSVYGWTEDPLIEFYIVENWGTKRPEKGTYITTFTSEGDEYDVYICKRNNASSIIGDCDFYQYWSVRKTSRTAGHIDISSHFKTWEELGMKLGKLYEISLCVEGLSQSSGKAAIYKNDIIRTY